MFFRRSSIIENEDATSSIIFCLMRSTRRVSYDVLPCNNAHKHEGTFEMKMVKQKDQVEKILCLL